MTKLATLLLLVAPLILNGCSRNIFSIHKIDIEQGNLLNPAAVAEVSPGMNRKQVIALIGRPILQPVLNPNRWEYVYYLKHPDKPAEESRLTIYFSNDKVVDVKKVQ